MKLLKRESLLSELESVASGLARQEVVEQSTCFVFTKDGRVITYNEEIACSRASSAGITGAVRAKPLLDLLRKLPDEEIRVGVEGNEFRVQTRSGKAGIAMEAQVMLPVGDVEIPQDSWQPIDPGLCQAAADAADCVSTVEDQFVLTCVHLTPEFVESCDNFQATRHSLQTGLRGDVMIRGKTMRQVCQLAVTEANEGTNWVHFRNKDGLVVSVRRYLEQYPPIGGILAERGEPGTLPKGLAQAADRAGVFSNENAEDNRVSVKIKQDRLMVKGQGAQGWYQQVLPVKYQGPPLDFTIAPALLCRIVQDDSECEISPTKIILRRGKMVFVAALRDPANTVTEDAAA